MRASQLLTRFIFVTTVAMVSACATVNSPNGAYLGTYPHVKRPNLVVADIDRSLTVYRDVIGLIAGEPSLSSEDSYSYPVFNIRRGTPIRSVALSEQSESRVLALTELKVLDLPRPHEKPYMSAIVIGITDLAGKFEKLKAMGLTVTDPKVASGVEFDFVEQAFIDFDGHLIVCYEVLYE